MQPLDGALHQRREILAAPGQRQGLGEEATESVAVTLPTSARVYSRGVWACSARLLGRARHVQHVAAGSFDEQRLFGAEVIGDLARKGVRGSSDIRDRGAGQAALPEQTAGAIEQARPHLATGSTRRAGSVFRVAGQQLQKRSGRTWEPFCPLYSIFV